MMKPHDDMEKHLQRFRPVGPPPSLRERVLAAAQAGPPTRLWRPSPFWVAMAAMLLVAVGLHRAADGLAARSARSVGLGPAIWTESADEAAKLLGGDANAQAYVALGLVASDDRTDPMILGRTAQ